MASAYWVELIDFGLKRMASAMGSPPLCRELRRRGAIGLMASNLPAGRRVVVGADEDLPRLASLRGADHAVGLHDLDQPRGAGVAELEAALQVRGAGLAGGQYHAHRLVVLRVFEVLDAVRAALLLRRPGDLLQESRLALVALHELDDLVDLLLRHVRAVNAADARRARREEEHVAVAEELLRPLRVEDGARVHLRGHLIGDARGEIRLDHAGDHVDRRALRGHDEVDADGARLL